MKYILIKGNTSAGKASTVNEVCRRLKPEKICRLYFSENGKVSLHTVYSSGDLADGNYLVTIRSKRVLMVSNAPTQQRVKISTIIDSLLSISITVEFAIVAMSGSEKLKDFATAKELAKYGKCIYETKIWRIPSHKFNLTEEWNKRISYLTAITLHNI
ncbi:hypothetical protein [Flavobacterium psychrotrophum]|uniref:hypothetical protein n=1 Tax=Flavobacterium psychrotrophum TaxID=2294119 RepID=UPI0013C4CBA1|nr:hypothetical protein [Flavobacterium psychrotrophum]